MSLGFVGKCRKIVEDEERAVYAYSGENWNDPSSQSGDVHLLDGEITIRKRCLEEPEIHTRLRKTPSGKKELQTKRITHVVDIQRHIEDGNITIDKKCKNEFNRSRSSGANYIACGLLLKIFTSYQEQGVLPEQESFIQ